MSVEGHIRRWQREGVIDDATAARLLDYERRRQGPTRAGPSPLAWAVGGLGAATVALGVISVVASSWQVISGRTKLGVDLALLIGLAGALWRVRSRAQEHAGWLQDTLIALYYGLTLASLALVGQVYQLHTPAWQGLSLWTLATAPLILLGRSGTLGALWCVGLHLSYGVGVFALLEHLDGSLSDRALCDLAVSLGCATPLAALAFASTPWLRARRPRLARAFAACVWVYVALGSLMIGFIWYLDLSDDECLRWGALAVGALALLWHQVLPWLLPDSSRQVRHGVSALLVVTAGTLIAGGALPHETAAAAGAIHQLACLGILAWICAHNGWLRLFQGLTALLALRIVIVYIELFSSLLFTGFGLITGGSLALVVTWVWLRRSRELAQRWSQEASRGA